MNIAEFNDIIEPNDQTAARLEHLHKMQQLVGNVYPNKFDRSNLSGNQDTITALINFEPVVDATKQMAEIKAALEPGERPPAEKKDALNETLQALGTVRIAGRVMTPIRGNFVHLTDGVNKLQIYCNKKGPLALVKNDGQNTLDEENGWAAWQIIDHGDFIGSEGYLFITNTGEVSVHVEKLQFLAKAMLPMPDKMHGIADPELRRRYRYADLIASSLQVEHQEGELTTREVFERRAKLISGMRRYLEDHGYVEVETPMLTPKATGAAAKPFETHHNALDIPLYARIAPELYLKRLTVGGFEKVYELNRNFRNEGLSQRHNPEFTMLEFYCAYMDVNGMMDFAEAMIQEAVKKANGGSLVVKYDGVEIDFNKFESISMAKVVADNLPFYCKSRGIDEDFLSEPINQFAVFSFYTNIETQTDHQYDDHVSAIRNDPNSLVGEAYKVSRDVYQKERFPDNDYLDRNWNLAQKEAEYRHKNDSSPSSMSLTALFDRVGEPNLIQPTFVIDYPKSISPLSKASPTNPEIAERFELFINGMEIANGFSELNDPKEQYERFVDQMSQREGGDEEAMVLDEDYIKALSYGMPPAAGIGIGIDRLTMLLTNKHSIRDVILFPHMRPETRENSSAETE